MSEPALRVDDLSGGYGQLTVIRDFSLMVARGTTTAVLGPNGVGKSTLLRIIAGLATQSGGTIGVAGQNLTGVSADKRLLHIVLVPEGRLLLGRFTVRDNIYLFAVRRVGRRAAAVAVDRAFDVFPALRGRARDRADSLSGGQQQMLALARALALEPSLLLLDEPSIGLAPVILDEVAAVIRELADGGLTVIVTEQNTRWLRDIVDHAVVLQHGRVIERGGQDLVRDTRALQDLYLGTTAQTRDGQHGVQAVEGVSR